MEELFQEAASIIQDGLNSILQHPSVVVLNIIVFLLMLFFVTVFYWKRVTLFLEKRQQALTEEFDKADEERKNAQILQQKAITEYEHMKAETESLKEQLTQDAYKQQEKLLEDARLEAKQRIEQAEKDIEYERIQANEEIKQSIKEIAFAAAEKIIKREIDHTKNQDIIEEIISESSDLNE